MPEKHGGAGNPSRDRKEKHGLFVLYPESDDAHVETDIVVIHGLGGDAFSTWTADNGKMWPRDFIPKIFPMGRVMTFGYDSKWAFSPSVADIQDFALDLLTRLRNKRWAPEAMTRPIVFICHSLGGIVCKKALLLSQSLTYYANIIEKTAAVLFFGCPHRGSRVASWATVTSNFINTCTFHQPMRKKLLEDLSSSSKLLAEVSSEFKFIAGGFDIKTFYETEMMLPLRGPVVERDSAIIGLPNEQMIPIAANHREMVRFQDYTSHKFESVRFALKELIEGSPVNINELKLTVFYLFKELDVVEYDALLANVPDRAPETCEWLPQHPSFSSWLSSSSSDILWLRGYPGVGKTVLTKYLIVSVIPSSYVVSRTEQRLKNSDDDVGSTQFLAYFLCSKRSRGWQLEENVLKSILHQLLIGNSKLAKSLKIFERVTDKRLLTFLSEVSDLWNALRVALVAAQWNVIYLIFDALDEMEAAKSLQFAKRLRLLIDSIAPQIEPRSIKILITSRPIPELDEALSSVSIAVRSERDVRHLITGQARRLASTYHIRPELEAKIVETISEKAGAMFLWARLAWEELCHNITDAKSVESGLTRANMFPPSLEPLYEDILNRLNTAQLSLLFKVLEWLVGANRPLTLPEMRYAIALEDGKSTLAAVNKNMVSEDRLRELCPTLIKMDESGHLQFVHISIKDFLTDSSTSPRFRIDMAAVQAKIAVRCMRSLHLSGFDADDVRIRLCERDVQMEKEMWDFSAEYQLLIYASLHWPIHAGLAGESAAVWDAFKDFCAHGSSVKLWLMLHIYDNTLRAQQAWFQHREMWKETNVPPPLHIAVYLNNGFLVEKLVCTGADVNAVNFGWFQDGAYTPQIAKGALLHFTTLSEQMMNLILDSGADMNIQNESGLTPLAQAIVTHDETQALLLSHSALRRASKTGKMIVEPNVLYLAITCSMKEMVALILNEASYDLSDKKYWRVDDTTSGRYLNTPLEHVCLFGLESMTRLLLSNAKMVAAQRDKDRMHPRINPTTLAMLAALQGWGDIALVCLQSFDTDISTDRDKYRRTILHHAVIEEWHEILEFCISKMAKSKLNVLDKDGMTALHYSGAHRNWYAAKRLLEAGAQPSVEDTVGRTPLHTAAEAGAERVLKLMLEHNAVQESLANSDHKRMTVLHYVATWNLLDVAEHLVESGQIDVCARNSDGRTAAHLACMFGSTAVVSLLLSTGLIDVNAADSYGNTLLHCAVEGKVQSCVEELVWREGIELNQMNRLLKTALDVTHSYLDQEHARLVRGVLEDAGCRPGLWRPRRSYAHLVETLTDEAVRTVPEDKRELRLVCQGVYSAPHQEQRAGESNRASGDGPRSG